MILQSRRSNDPETLRQNGPLKTKSGKETCLYRRSKNSQVKIQRGLIQDKI